MSISLVSSSHAGAPRGAHIGRTCIQAEPMQRLACYGFGYGMGTIELPVVDLVTCPIELRDDPSAVVLDLEHPVARPVGDEGVRLAPAVPRGHDPRREGDHAREQVPIGQSEREGVGGSVGEAPY